MFDKFLLALKLRFPLFFSPHSQPKTPPRLWERNSVCYASFKILWLCLFDIDAYSLKLDLQYLIISVTRTGVTLYLQTLLAMVKIK